MLGTDGPSDSGKTEFALSAPGPGIVVCLDRGFDALFDNPNPPPTRRDDYGFKIIQAPMATQSYDPKTFQPYWKDFYTEYCKALVNQDAKVVVIDGDSDSYELQRLAEWGTLQGIVSLRYAGINGARRAMYARAYDSGKIVIATNKITKHYKAVRDENGVIKVGADGKQIREWDGKSYERQGFEDQEYLWQIQISHMFRDKPDGGREWGLRINKCKPNPEMIGQELWGSDCHFQGLVETVYPNVSLKEWGY